MNIVLANPLYWGSLGETAEYLRRAKKLESILLIGSSKISRNSRNRHLTRFIRRRVDRKLRLSAAAFPSLNSRTPIAVLPLTRFMRPLLSTTVQPTELLPISKPTPYSSAILKPPQITTHIEYLFLLSTILNTTCNTEI